MSVERAAPGHSDTDYTDCECQEGLDHDLFKCNCGCHRGIWEAEPKSWQPGEGEAPGPLASDDGIDIVDAVLPQWPAQPWTPYPNRWSDGPSLVELDAYGDFAPERSDQEGRGQ